MKLRDYSNKLGLSYQSAWNHFKKGKIPGAYKTDTGIVIVPDDFFLVKGRGVIIYIRYDGSERVQSKLLRLESWCMARGYKIIDIVIEEGDSWKNHEKLYSILDRTDWEKIVVEDPKEIYPVGSKIVKVLTRDRVEFMRNYNIEDSNMVSELMSLLNLMCQFLHLDEKQTKDKTHKIFKMINKELQQ